MSDQLLALQTEYSQVDGIWDFLIDKSLYRLATGEYVFCEESWETGCYFPEKCVRSKNWTTLTSMFSKKNQIKIYPSKEMNLIVQEFDEFKLQIQTEEVFVSLNDLDRFNHDEFLNLLMNSRK